MSPDPGTALKGAMASLRTEPCMGLARMVVVDAMRKPCCCTSTLMFAATESRTVFVSASLMLKTTYAGPTEMSDAKVKRTSADVEDIVTICDASSRSRRFCTLTASTRKGRDESPLTAWTDTPMRQTSMKRKILGSSGFPYTSWEVCTEDSAEPQDQNPPSSCDTATTRITYVDKSCGSRTLVLQEFTPGSSNARLRATNLAKRLRSTTCFPVPSAVAPEASVAASASYASSPTKAFAPAGTGALSIRAIGAAMPFAIIKGPPAFL
mmetsp:Transcript_37922/g.89026  ORF Transcript_37922/g.89026 Transcript_37922/m.89026 type:complete len:266 (-) Transcript_37922:735-1532(-)